MGSLQVPQKRKKSDCDDEDDIIKDGALTSAAENFFEALCNANPQSPIHGDQDLPFA